MAWRYAKTKDSRCLAQSASTLQAANADNNIAKSSSVYYWLGGTRGRLKPTFSPEERNDYRRMSMRKSKVRVARRRTIRCSMPLPRLPESLWNRTRSSDGSPQIDLSGDWRNQELQRFGEQPEAGYSPLLSRLREPLVWDTRNCSRHRHDLRGQPGQSEHIQAPVRSVHARPPRVGQDRRASSGV